MALILHALLLLLTLQQQCEPAPAYPCFERQPWDARPQCLSALDLNLSIPESDCWAAKVQSEFYTGPESVEQVLVNRTTGDCYLLSSQCYLQSAPPSGFQSWLPCRSPGSPSSLTKLVFTIRAEAGVKAYEAFTYPSGNASVLSTEDTSQPAVFRSDVLDNPANLIALMPQREIHLVVYKSNAPVMMFIFDASNPLLTKGNWFSRVNLKASWPITDVASRTFNFFSIEGDVSNALDWSFVRRFFINYADGGCSLDTGILMVMDTDDVCDYAKGNFTAAPRILFNVRPDGKWLAGAQRADRLSIFVT